MGPGLSADPAAPGDLVDLLLRHLLAGKRLAEQALPALGVLLGPGAASRADLSRALRPAPVPALAALRLEVQRLRVQDAQAFHERSRSGAEVPPALRADLADLPLAAPRSCSLLADQAELLDSALSCAG